jgi:hypothetical protein
VSTLIDGHASPPLLPENPRYPTTIILVMTSVGVLGGPGLGGDPVITCWLDGDLRPHGEGHIDVTA